MPVIHSLAELGDHRQKSVVTRELAQAYLKKREQADIELRLDRCPVSLDPTFQNLAPRGSCARAGLTFDLPSHSFMRRPRSFGGPKPMARPYSPKSDSGAIERWAIFDAATGARLWLVHGSYKHVLQEAARAYGKRSDFYIRKA